MGKEIVSNVVNYVTLAAQDVTPMLAPLFRMFQVIQTQQYMTPLYWYWIFPMAKTLQMM
jgi:hypothetical protein